jgi:hypothetical protein
MSADRAAEELAQPVKVVNPGRGKKIAIAVAAVIAIAAVVLFTFGHDMLGGLLGEPSAAAPGVASSPVPSGASAAGSPRASATTVANPSAGTSHATIQGSVTPAKLANQKAAAEPSPASKAADAGVTALPVPTVNVDAATRSIDEATKGTPQKPKVKLPF